MLSRQVGGGVFGFLLRGGTLFAFSLFGLRHVSISIGGSRDRWSSFRHGDKTATSYRKFLCWLLSSWRLDLAVQSKFSRALTRKVGVLLLVVLEGELVGALDVLADAVEAEEKLRLADRAPEGKKKTPLGSARKSIRKITGTAIK
jgi:hypothetical protein